MKLYHLIPSLMLLFVHCLVVAQQITGLPPISLVAPVSRGAASLPALGINIPNLRAVLIVGPVGSSTNSFITEMKDYASLLRERGVTCTEIYSPQNSWEAIKKATEGAHFLLYAGHGIYDGSDIPKWVGSFCLDSGFVKSDVVIRDLQMAKNAIVLFNHTCFSAGAAAGDPEDIGVDEAKRRVTMYSTPFLSDEFSAYYASSWCYGLNSIIASLFAGQSLGDAYKSYCMYNESKTIKTKFPEEQSYDEWISNTYNYSFVGDSNKNLNDLFGH